MTATSTYPLVAWGSADDISAYSQGGTPIITSGVTDPFGGTGAYTVNDNDGAAAEYAYKDFTVTTPTSLPFLFFVKAGTATTSAVALLDTVAALSRCTLALTWSGGVPSASETSGLGSVLSPVSVGGGWYAVLATAGSIVSGNNHRLRLYGASTTTSATGTTSYYIRNAVLLDYPDNMTSWPEPREGSATAQAPSGTEDAWTVGTDYHLGGDIRWVPDSPTDTPAIVSGWYGDNESAGVNCGVAAMLTAGRDKQALVWVKDRSDCTTYVSGYLVQPMNGRPELEGNWRRKFGIELRSTSVYRGY